MVDLPQAKALALLPDLHDPGKIDGATAQILAAIDRSEATLIGYPVVQAVDGEKGEIKTILEKRYYTEYEAPPEFEKAGNPQSARAASVPPPGYSSPSPLPPSPLHDAVLPTAFETRNIGFEFAVTPHVLHNGNSIRLTLAQDRTYLLGFETYVLKIEQPQFITLTTNTTLAVRSGQRTLFAFHKMPETENQFELEILQAWAEPIK